MTSLVLDRRQGATIGLGRWKSAEKPGWCPDINTGLASNKLSIPE